MYKFLKLIRCNPNWELMKDFDRNKEESAKQLDVHLLLRKITFLEDCMNVLFRPPELKGMYLKGILPIDDIIKTRRNYRLYRKTKKLAEEMGEYSKMDANISIEDQSEHKQNKGLRMVFPEQDQDGNNISVSHNAILSTPVANNSEQWEASSS